MKCAEAGGPEGPSSKQMRHLPGLLGPGGIPLLEIEGAVGGRGVQIPSQERLDELVNVGRISLGHLLHPNLPLGIALV